MKALIDPSQNNRIVEIQKNEFAVAAPYFWIDCPDNIIPSKYSYVDGKFVFLDIDEILKEISNDNSKFSEYKSILLNDNRYDFSYIKEHIIEKKKCC